MAAIPALWLMPVQYKRTARAAGNALFLVLSPESIVQSQKTAQALFFWRKYVAPGSKTTQNSGLPTLDYSALTSSIKKTIFALL